jgi:hypothetical protein
MAAAPITNPKSDISGGSEDINNKSSILYYIIEFCQCDKDNKMKGSSLNDNVKMKKCNDKMTIRLLKTR